MKLIISDSMMLKVKYLLQKFPVKEWSGPAFYNFIEKKTPKGIERFFELVYFKPIDLGGKADTEFSGEELNKAIPGIWKAYPETKKCLQGLIHSHNSMGAYHSGTDVNQMEEAMEDINYKNGEDNFYPSLVVSSMHSKEFAFAVAYRDQYNTLHVIEKLPVLIPSQKIKKNAEWDKEVKYIVEQAKKKPQARYTASNYNSKQMGLLAADWHFNRNTNTYTTKTPLTIYQTKQSLKDLTIPDIKILSRDGMTTEKYLRRILTKGMCTTEEELEIFEKVIDTVIEEESIPEDITNELWTEASNYAGGVEDSDIPWEGPIC